MPGLMNDDTDSDEESPATARTCVVISARPGQVSSPPPPLSNSTSIRARSRKNRVYVFREFILQTFGTYLSDSCSSDAATTILDVAGGKGDLSWLLCNVDSINSVIIDPRRTQHAHLLKSINYLRLHPEEAAERCIPDRPTHQPLAALLPKLNDETQEYQTPSHLRLLLDEELVEAIQAVLRYCKTDNASCWEDFWCRASKKALDSQPLGYREETSCTMGQIVDASTALEAILSAKLILGFHPDQATEICMELACLLNIPFCVVPCCVFPSEFPNRTLRDGQSVRKYETFMVYLKEKYGPGLRQATLPFHETTTARSVALYRLPGDDLNYLAPQRSPNQSI